MKSVAIITARGGSKRIKRKNLRSFFGKPIIAYSISAALEAQCFSEVMVSTDDDEIADLSRSLGAQLPFMRSEESSTDNAGITEVLTEVVGEYRKVGKDFESLCCIFPTAPFITAAKLQKGMSVLQETGADCVLPVVAYSYPIQRSLKIENGRAIMLWPDNYSKMSQELTATYHDAGQFYCITVSSLFAQMRLFAEHTVPIVVPESETQDIDNEEDWRLAEMKYRVLSGF